MGCPHRAGWGAFLQGSCNEDDFLGEYTGDLITQDEADRRGRIYDRMNNSYLFNLNRQWVLDARHRCGGIDVGTA
jgi:histone-lysine N-methyltransferase EZH2